MGMRKELFERFVTPELRYFHLPSALTEKHLADEATKSQNYLHVVGAEDVEVALAF